MALTQQADERNRSRWRRAENLAYEKRDDLNTIVVKEGEAAAVLARTWAALGAMQGQHAEEDEDLELARDVILLSIPKSKAAVPEATAGLVDTPFRNLLLSSPVEMTIRISPPLDLFLNAADAQTYTLINSYLLSIRRAHLRLTDLWKITRLRRHHLAPPRPPFSVTRGGTAKTRALRERWAARSLYLRSAWTTSSATIFFLAETEAYLQIEIVEELWDDFHGWLTRKNPPSRLGSFPAPKPGNAQASMKVANHDPQTLSVAHRSYLCCLTQRLLLTQPSFSTPMYNLLIHTDHLVAMIHRLDSIWSSMDLESDEGVVDAFSNSEVEEMDVKSKLRALETRIKDSVEEVIRVLRQLSIDSSFLAEMEDDGLAHHDAYLLDEDEGRYIPKRTGGIDRLLMKLDFGGWFDNNRNTNEGEHRS